MTATGDLRWFEAIRTLLDRVHLMRADELAGVVGEVAAGLDLRTRIWLADYEQVTLRALPEAGRDIPDPMPLDGTLPGRAFRSVMSVSGDGRRWWVPMVDGTDRLGVVDFEPLTEVPGACSYASVNCSPAWSGT